ncbi:unnamed protein product, partial [Mesorhabditis belari]|uniref:Uncharacterized protein n=1 Tax=Mesorhabditis belari TaxID=2138241 RepID=A0AAF3EQ84_9BILA
MKPQKWQVSGMGVMAVGLFITILLLFHQISSSIQESVQVDPSTSPNDRDEIRDRRTLNSKKDCLDTVLLRSCRRNLNETQQELVEAPEKSADSRGKSQESGTKRRTKTSR